MPAPPGRKGGMPGRTGDAGNGGGWPGNPAAPMPRGTPIPAPACNRCSSCFKLSSACRRVQATGTVRTHRSMHPCTPHPAPAQRGPRHDPVTTPEPCPISLCVPWAARRCGPNETAALLCHALAPAAATPANVPQEQRMRGAPEPRHPLLHPDLQRPRSLAPCHRLLHTPHSHLGWRQDRVCRCMQGCGPNWLVPMWQHTKCIYQAAAHFSLTLLQNSTCAGKIPQITFDDSGQQCRSLREAQVAVHLWSACASCSGPLPLQPEVRCA